MALPVLLVILGAKAFAGTKVGTAIVTAVTSATKAGAVAKAGAAAKAAVGGGARASIGVVQPAAKSGVAAGTGTAATTEAGKETSQLLTFLTGALSGGGTAALIGLTKALLGKEHAKKLKIKAGDIEIEFEGEMSDEKIKSRIDLFNQELRGVKIVAELVSEQETVVATEDEDGKITVITKKKGKQQAKTKGKKKS